MSTAAEQTAASVAAVEAKIREALETGDPYLWMPATFTRPLSGTEDFPSMGDKLLKVVDAAWVSPEGRLVLDGWQRWLIRHILEVYPEGHPLAGELRFRQVLCSLGRQNGKSVLGAIFGLFGLLLAGQGAEVVSIASTVEQANIIYKRVKHVIDTQPALGARFKTTGTRGIASKGSLPGTSYVVKTGRADALQGIPIRVCLFDEVHICEPESWDAVVLGTSAQKNGLVLGITTAGDDKSALLKRLYEVGKAAAAQDGDYDERFGFFLWEAPAHLPISDPMFLVSANPAIACGRLPLARELNAIKTMPENSARRYRGNQFVASESSWLAPSLWLSLPRENVPEGDVVLAVSRGLNWSSATITANAKGPDGRLYTEVVASYVNPTIDLLEDELVALWDKARPRKVFMEAADLKDLAMRLRERGMDTEYLTVGQMVNVAATSYSAIAERRVAHAHDPIVADQVPKTVAKSSGDGHRISKRDSLGDVDAVVASMIGLYGAEVTKAESNAVYVG